MKIVGCDLHARQQTIAMVDTETGEFTEKTLCHEGNAVREFYAALEGPVVVGIEATGAMQWFLEVLEELGIECRVIPLLGPAHLFSSLRAWRVNAGSTSRSYAFRLDSGKAPSRWCLQHLPATSRYATCEVTRLGR